MARQFSYKAPKFEELIGSSNFTSWHRNIRNVVAEKKGLGHLDRTSKRPEEAPETPETKALRSATASAVATALAGQGTIEGRQTAWDDEDASIASLLMQAVCEDIRPELDNVKTAASRWDILLLYRPNGTSEYNRLMAVYRNFHHSLYDGVQQYCQKFTTLVAELRGIDSEPTLKDQNMVFLLNIYPEYREWASRKRSEIATTDTYISMIQLTTEIRNEDELMQSLSIREQHVAAFSSHQNNKKDTTARDQGSAHRPIDKPVDDAKCDHCSKRHQSSQCWTKHPDKRPEWLKKKKYSGSKASKPKAFAQSVDAGSISEGRPVTCIAMVDTRMVSEHHALTSISPLASAWLLDTGATAHMCNNRGLFSTFTPLVERIVGAVAASYGRGSISMAWRTPTGINCMVDMVDVLYTPDLFTNLLSASKLRASGLYITTKDYTIRRIANDSIIGQAPLIGKDLFQLDVAYVIPLAGDRIGYAAPLTIQKQDAFVGAPALEAEPNSEEIISEAITTASKEDASESLIKWHRRLGHLGRAAQVKIMSTISGVQLPDPSEKITCEACMLGKSKKQISRARMTRALSVFELVHADTAHITPNGINGATGFSSLTDDYSRHRNIDINAQKSDAFQHLINYQKRIKNQYGRGIQRLRIDNGREYGVQRLQDWANEEGITIEYVPPYTSNQAGVAESTNWVIFRKARTMALDAALSPSLWPEVVKAAAYLYNRTPSATVLGSVDSSAISPNDSILNDAGVGCFSLASHREYLHLRVYGCRAYAYIPRDLRVQSQKMAKRAEKGVLVGYEGSSIYRIWLPHTQRVVRSSSVTFIEDPLPPKPTTGTYIEMISSGHVIDGADSESSDSEESIPGIGSGGATASAPGTKHRRGIKGSGIEIRVPPPTWRAAPDISGRDVQSSRNMASNYSLVASHSEDPTSYEEAMASVESSQWRDAIQEEIASLLENETWETVDPPPGVRILGGRYVFKKKLGLNGEVLRYKARWVAKGYLQREGIDYLETTANVVRMEAWRILVAISTIYDFDIEQMDVVTAFLNGKIDVELYMDQPTGYGEKGKVCRMLRTLYGLKQSGNIWCTELETQLATMGFTPLISDQCVYIRSAGTPDAAFIATWVDDLLIMGQNSAVIADIKADLSRKFKMKDLGPVSQYLGMRIQRDRVNRVTTIDQLAYMDRILQKAGFTEHSNPSPIPMGATRLVKNLGQASEEDVRKFQTAIGELIWMSTGTRLDIAFATSTLSRYMSNPSSEHFQALKKLYRYLLGARLALKYTGVPGARIVSGVSPGGDIYLDTYSDSDWGGDEDNRRSTTGYFFEIAGGAISWASRRQKTVSLSSTEAEYMALSETARELKWVSTFVADLGFAVRKPLTIYCDSESAMALSDTKGTIHRRRTKHIDIRHHYIKERVEDGEIKLLHVPTSEMTADGLTKPLSAPLFVRSIGQLRLIKIAR